MTVEESRSVLEALSMAQTWLIIGVVLGAVEMLTVTFWALPFALGAFVSALAAWLDLTFNAQLAVFAVASVVMLFVIQSWLKRYNKSHGPDELRSNTSAMIGREAVVVEAIESSVKPGAVKLGGELWTAHAQNGAAIAVGVTVIILEVGGATVRVEPKSE